MKTFCKSKQRSGNRNVQKCMSVIVCEILFDAEKKKYGIKLLVVSHEGKLESMFQQQIILYNMSTIQKQIYIILIIDKY